MTIEYQSVEYALHENLVKLQEIFSLLGFDQSLTDSINECKELVETKKYVVAVMGEFKRGKSSLINALMGSRILPADATPTTATVNRIVYGKSSKTEIHYKNGKVQEISIDELADYVTQTTSDGKARALSIKEAVVYAPTVICQNHVEIIDTPGLNDEEEMTKAAISMLKSIDGVVIPIHARSPFSETEKKFVCQMIKSENIHNLVFVVTFLDLLDEDDYDYDKFMAYVSDRIKKSVLEELTQTKADDHLLQRANRMLDEMKIFGVSSELALRSFVSNNKTMLKQSHFEEFSANLMRVITSEQLENVLRRSVAEFFRLQGSMTEQNEKRLRSFEEKIAAKKYVVDSIDDYRTSAKTELENILQSSSAERERILSGFFRMKNRLADEFLKGVFALNGKPGWVANDFLNTTAINTGVLMNNLLSEKVKLPLIDQLQADLATFLKYRKSTLWPRLEKLGVAELLDQRIISEDMVAKMRTAISKNEFKWVIDERSVPRQWINRNGTATIPPNWMANGQVMFDIALRMINVSVDVYLQSFKVVLESIVKDWTAIIAEDAEVFNRSAELKLGQAKEEVEIEIKSYKSNYQALQQKVDRIVEDNRVLLRQYLDQAGPC